MRFSLNSRYVPSTVNKLMIKKLHVVLLFWGNLLKVVKIVELLDVILVETFINCFNPKNMQNSL